MCSRRQLPLCLKRLVLAASLAGVVGFSVPGCSDGGRDATVSPEAKAKAKENFKKRFANFGETKKDLKAKR